MGRVVVAGSINMDVVATALRHPRIGETVAGHEILHFPGGKGANQAIAAARLGAPTLLIGRIGDDAFGRELKAFLAAERVDVARVRMVPNAQTGTAIITVANGDNTIVVVPGANAMLGAADVTAVPLKAGDVAISQLEISLATVRAFLGHARSAGVTTILNPAPATQLDRDILDLADVLIVNETELGTLAGTGIDATSDDDAIAAVAGSLLTRPTGIICVTLGGRGVIAWIEGKVHVIPGRPVDVIDTTGAGDCFVGAVAAGLARGMRAQDALTSANIAASLSVQRMGAAPSMPTAADVTAISDRPVSSPPASFAPRY